VEGEEGSYVVVVIVVASEDLTTSEISERIASAEVTEEWEVVHATTTSADSTADDPVNVGLILGLVGLGVVLNTVTFFIYMKYNKYRTVMKNDQGQEYTVPV
jgi:hypothetical protein